MTTVLAPQTGLPGRFRDDGYDLPPDLPFDRWCEILETLQIMERSVKWWVGDALRYGEAAYGEKASQAFPDAFSGSPYAESTLRAAAWVSDRFPRGTRVEGVTWTHHRVVAELPTLEAVALLKEAARVNNDPKIDGYVSSRDLIERGRRVKARLEGTAVTLSGTPVEPADDLEWRPTRADLTVDARRDLEVKLSEMSASRRGAFEAGAMWAWMYADDLDLFTRDGAS